MHDVGDCAVGHVEADTEVNVGKITVKLHQCHEKLVCMRKHINFPLAVISDRELVTNCQQCREMSGSWKASVVLDQRIVTFNCIK